MAFIFVINYSTVLSLALKILINNCQQLFKNTGTFSSIIENANALLRILAQACLHNCPMPIPNKLKTIG